MKHSESIAALAGALAKAQLQIEPASKNATNPHFRSHYADLASIWDACRGPLNTNGLSIVQFPCDGEMSPGDRSEYLVDEDLWSCGDRWLHA